MKPASFFAMVANMAVLRNPLNTFIALSTCVRMPDSTAAYQ